MKEELVFAQTLEQICTLARSQGNVVSKEQVEQSFVEAGMALADAQFDLIFEYLKGKKIGIGEPADPFDYLSEEEVDYLQDYLSSLEGLADVTEGEKEAITLSAIAGDYAAKQRLMEINLVQVTEIAKLYAGQGTFLEDLIGEGNVALTMAVEMLGTAKNVKEAQGQIASMIMETMETYIDENVQQKKTGDKIAVDANEVLDAAKELAEELGRKVTMEELAEESGFSMARIREAVRLTGDKIDYLET